MTDIPDEFPIPERAFEQQRSLLSRQAAEGPQRRRGRRGMLAAGLASAGVLGVLLVTPAFGIRGELLDLIQGKPAPPEIKTYFASSNKLRARMFASAETAGAELHDRFSPVLASEARGVFAIESPDGPIYLWAAPTEDGRQCWLLETNSPSERGGFSGLSSCGGISASPSIQAGTLWTADRPSVQIVRARIYDESIARLDIQLRDSSVVSLPVVDGFALGTVSREAKVSAIVGRDSDGDEVARIIRD
jgi:hypothetical protein